MTKKKRISFVCDFLFLKCSKESVKYKTTLDSPISNYPQKLICTEHKGLKLSLENLQTLDLILALDTQSLESVYLQVTF